MLTIRSVISTIAPLMGMLCALGTAVAAPYQAQLGGAIDQYLQQKQSPIAGNGQVFFDQGVTWDVDPRLIVAIAGQEQNFGKADSSCNSVYNAWSWFYNGRCPQAAFVSWAEGIETVTHYMRTSYFDRYGARTIPAIGAIYCTEACGDWAENVSAFYAAGLGGNTNDLTFARLSAPPPPECPPVFADNFDRPDSTVVGNGWTTVSGAITELQIRNNEVIDLDRLAGMYRPIPELTAPITVSATLKEMNGYGGLLRRYAADLCIQNNGSIGSGYCLTFLRGDQNYSNSAVALSDNGQRVDLTYPTHQYGPELFVTATFSVDGSVYGTVGDGVTQAPFSFVPRTIQSNGTNFAYITEGPDDRTSVFTYPRFDNVSITTVCE